MGFNDFAQDLLDNDQGMDFLDHTSVLRQPATSMDIQKNIEFFFSPTCPVRKTAVPQLSFSHPVQVQTTFDKKALP